jgi:hypothetical protein
VPGLIKGSTKPVLLISLNWESYLLTHCIVMSLAVTSVKNTKRQMEKQRDDENFAYVAAWEYKGKPSDAVYKEHWFSIMLNW